MKNAVGLEGGARKQPETAVAHFLWKDEETGDHLTIEVRGSEDFLRGLELQGFVRLPEILSGLPRRKSGAWENGTHGGTLLSSSIDEGSASQAASDGEHSLVAWREQGGDPGRARRRGA